MNRELTLNISNLHGGDNYLRQDFEEKQKFVKSQNRTRKSKGVIPASQQASETIVTEKYGIFVNTFGVVNGTPAIKPYNGTDAIESLQFYYPLSQKFKGALDEAATLVARAEQYSSKAQDSRVFGSMTEASSLMKLIRVMPPTDIRLEDVNSLIPKKRYPQLMNNSFRGGARTMSFIYFDVIPSAIGKISLVYPDDLEPAVNRVLEEVQKIPLFNRRRSYITIDAAS